MENYIKKRETLSSFENHVHHPCYRFVSCPNQLVSFCFFFYQRNFSSFSFVANIYQEMGNLPKRYFIFYIFILILHLLDAQNS